MLGAQFSTMSSASNVRFNRSQARPFLANGRNPAARSRPVGAVSVRAEISYIMVKPDGVQRGLVGEIISRFERKGFQLKALKMYSTPKEVKMGLEGKMLGKGGN